MTCTKADGRDADIVKPYDSRLRRDSEQTVSTVCPVVKIRVDA